MGDGTHQLTVKGKDRGSNENRLEVDVDTSTQAHKLKKFARSLLGKEAGEVTKEYYVYWPCNDDHITVCCYVVELPGETELVIEESLEREVSSVQYPHVFVEVETTGAFILEVWEERVIGGLRKTGMEVDRAPGSLFEMFIQRPSELYREIENAFTESLIGVSDDKKSD